MPSGTVKWFNNAKGYGFILPDEGGEDLFVHYTSILMDGYKTLKAGQIVQFEIVEGGKGFHATNIRVPNTSSSLSNPSANTEESSADSDNNLQPSPDLGHEAGSAEHKTEATRSSQLEPMS